MFQPASEMTGQVRKKPDSRNRDPIPGNGLDPALYPFTSRFMTVNGRRMHYIDEGEGHPVVMVHGNPTWSFYYRDLIKALKNRYRVIAPDHIGMGLSEKPDDREYEFTATRRLKDLETFLDCLGIRRFTLVAHDWGGIIGTCYATLHPEKIAGLVMLNTAGFIWPVNKKLPIPLFMARIPYISALFIRGLNVFARGAVHIGMKRKSMAKNVARGMLYPYSTWNDRLAIHRFIQDIPVRPGNKGFDMGLFMESRLKLLSHVPMLLCWGLADFVFCGKMLDEFVRHFPDAEVRRFEDGGHYILEDAAEEVIPAIERFVDTKVVHGPDGPAIPEKKPVDPSFRSLNDLLLSIAGKKPDRNVVVHMQTMKSGHPGYEYMTYGEVDRESNRIAHGLEKIGIRKGMHTVLMVTPGKDFFCLLSGIFKVGAIPVFVDPGMGVRNLKTCIGEAEPEAFIGIPRAHAARVALGWARKTIRINVTVGKKYFWGGYTLDQVKRVGAVEPYLMEHPDPDAMQMIAFTSGNTGVPKGVIFTQRIFASILEVLSGLIQPLEGDADLSTFPPFALMGPAMGVPSVIPDMDATKPGKADPEKLVRAINDQRCTSMFASPALIEKIGKYCEKEGITLPTLKRVFSAGAPARLDSLKRFVKALSPGVEVLTPYGATEALPVSVIGSRELLGETEALSEKGGGVCVGRPVPGVDVAVIPITDDPVETWDESLRLPPGEMGEITAKGPVVTVSYFQRDKQNRLAKITDPSGGTWHRMGDVGYFDDTGRLFMCGRKGHRVEAQGKTFFSLPCEAIYNRHPDVFRSALVGVTIKGRVEPAIVIELSPHVKPGKTYKKELTEKLLAMGREFKHTSPIRTVLYHKKFPVDVRHNAKIVREKLAEWAQKEVK
jgi:acyl-CoA synthetase (AMP-forming)/AMP-acid ligase II/pimeloyl-ACP methyl ester carboxylesterase